MGWRRDEELRPTGPCAASVQDYSFTPASSGAESKLVRKLGDSIVEASPEGKHLTLTLYCQGLARRQALTLYCQGLAQWQSPRG